MLNAHTTYVHIYHYINCVVVKIRIFMLINLDITNNAKVVANQRKLCTSRSVHYDRYIQLLDITVD